MRKFKTLFWKHKFSGAMWIRLLVSPILIILVFVGAFCEKTYEFLDESLPKVKEK